MRSLRAGALHRAAFEAGKWAKRDTRAGEVEGP